MASPNEASVGSTRTRSKTSSSSCSAAQDSIAVFTAWLSFRFGSVTSNTRLQPSVLRSAPTSRVTPGPNLMADVSMVNEDSNDIQVPHGSQLIGCLLYT